MNFPTIALLIALPIGLALMTLILGRWPRVAWAVGIAGALIVALLAWIAGPDTGSDAAVWSFAGRMFELTPFVGRVLALLALGAALLFVLQWLTAGPAALVPGGLAALGLLAAAFTVRPFALGVVGLLAATAVVVPSLYGGRTTSAAAAWRAFLPVALAAPLLVGAGWLLDSGQAQGDSASILLLLSTLLLLGGFPFTMWITGIVREAPFHAVILLIGLVGAGTAVWLGLVLDEFPVARGSTVFQTAVLGSVLLSSVIAAFGLGRASALRDVVAYGLVFDAGMQVAALMVPGPSLAAVLAVGTIGRLLVLLLLAAAMAWREANSREVSAVSPSWPQLLLAYGGLGLMGLPLTPTFIARWATLPAIAGQSVWVLLVVLLAMGYSAVVVVRWALAEESPVRDASRYAAASRILAVGVLFLALFMGLLGPHLLEYLSGLVSG